MRIVHDPQPPQAVLGPCFSTDLWFAPLTSMWGPRQDMLRGQPVFDAQAWNVGKMLHVVRHQRQVVGQGH